MDSLSHSRGVLNVKNAQGLYWQVGEDDIAKNSLHTPGYLLAQSKMVNSLEDLLFVSSLYFAN